MTENEKAYFSAMYDKYSKVIYGICLMYTKCKKNAEEAVADAFVRLKNKVMRRVEENEMKKSTIKRTGGMIIAAAAAAVIGTVSVFAATPTGQEAIRNIISYFQNDKASEITSLADLEKYNEAIGASDSKHGFTLTLDNVAADDNFVHVFYTIKSETPFVNDVKDTEITGPMIWADIVINGKFAGYMGNNNIEDGYAPYDPQDMSMKMSICEMIMLRHLKA